MGRGNNSNLLYGGMPNLRGNKDFFLELKQLFNDTSENQIKSWLKATKIIVNFDTNNQGLKELYQQDQSIGYRLTCALRFSQQDMSAKDLPLFNALNQLPKDIFDQEEVLTSLQVKILHETDFQERSVYHEVYQNIKEKLIYLNDQQIFNSNGAISLSKKRIPNGSKLLPFA